MLSLIIKENFAQILTEVIFMKFHEKLSFLINLTQTSNKTLATKLSIDPSLVSMLRTGKRKMPKNADYIKTMAEHFGKNCMSEYQLYSLADAMKNENVKLISSPFHLANLIFNWLNDNNIDVSPKIESSNLMSSTTDKGIPPPMSNVDIFYTTSGRRGALSVLYQHIKNSPIPSAPFNRIFVSIDEDLEWIYEDLEFFSSLQRTLFKLIGDGMRICHIIHSNTDPVQLRNYLKLWLPLYVTGGVEAHWCYHPQPQIYRRSIILAPLSGAIFYNTANTKRDDPATLITTDRQLMHSLTYEFQSYFPHFTPFLEQITAEEGLLKNVEESYQKLTSKIQQSPSLPVETTPAELVLHCIETAASDTHKEFLRAHLNQMARFEQSLSDKNFTYTDIAYLASAQAVKDGQVRILLSNGPLGEVVIYTPEMYVIHLQNILRLLIKYPNYHFVPSLHRLHYNFVLMIQDDKQAVLIRTAPPFKSFSIKHPQIVSACHDILTTEKNMFMLTQSRESIIQRIKDLISELS